MRTAGYRLIGKSSLLRDGVTFLALCCLTVVLFGITSFLFRSFEEHREDLSREWAVRGEKAMAAQRPDEAVAALRTSLAYRPNRREDQLLLAQALADAGKNEEATNYFLNLWESRPGDGTVNLQLARLAKKRGHAPEAINYYRASVFGSWDGDGAKRRRAVRLELADYLAQRGDVGSARNEILTAAGNAPDNENLTVLFADRLQAIGDLPDALMLYRRAMVESPRRRDILTKAGLVAYKLGDYPRAQRLLTRALQISPGTRDDADLKALAAKSERLQALSLSRDLPAQERGAHLLAASSIARLRFKTCATHLNELPAALPALKARWESAGRFLRGDALFHDAAAQDMVAQLVSDTEAQTASFCGAPTGDDALLLMLTQAAH